MDFPEQVIQQLGVGVEAIIVRKMLRELIHNESDLEILNNIMEKKGIIRTKRINKLFNCLYELAEIKNNMQKMIS